MSNQQKVRDFHIAIGSDMPTVPTAHVPASVLQLRQTLLQEEYEEVREALGQLALTPNPETLAKAAHELADLLYVTYGALAALGVDGDAVFAEVHRVNMHKTSGERRADGKQLKPEGWQPADIAAVLNRLSRVEQEQYCLP